MVLPVAAALAGLGKGTKLQPVVVPDAGVDVVVQRPTVGGCEGVDGVVGDVGPALDVGLLRVALGCFRLALAHPLGSPLGVHCAGGVIEGAEDAGGHVQVAVVQAAQGGRLPGAPAVRAAGRSGGSRGGFAGEEAGHGGDFDFQRDGGGFTHEGAFSVARRLVPRALSASRV